MTKVSAATYVSLRQAEKPEFAANKGFAAKAAATLANKSVDGKNAGEWTVSGESDVTYVADSIRVTTNGKASGAEVATIVKNGSTYIYDGSGYTGTQEYYADDSNSDAWQVVTGAGNDTIHYGATKPATLDGGAGNDMFKISGAGATAYVTLGEGKDTVDLTGDTATFALQDYDAANDVIKVGTSLAPTAAIDTVKSDGSISVSAGGTATINSTDGYYEAVLATDTAKQDVYFAGTAGTIMDASAKKTGVFMVGTTNDTTSDTLVGGAGRDTIVAGKGDKVNGGAGNDEIYLAGTNTMVELSSDGGHDTLHKLTDAVTPTIYVNADTLNDDVLLTSDDKSNLKVKLGSAYIDADATVTGKNDEKLTFVTAAGTTQKVRAILKNAANATYNYGATDDDVDIFYGTAKDTTVNFANYDKGNLVVNLAGDERFENAKKYHNITKVTGSNTYDSVLVGGTANVTLTAGAGNVSTSLWGGAKGNDVLVGTGDSKDTFFFGAGDGSDTIQSYTAASTAEVGGNDVLYTYGAATQVTFSGSTTVSMAYSDGSKLTLGVTGTDNSVGGAVVDYTVDGATFKRVVVGSTLANDTFTYNSDVEIYYGAAGKTNTMQVKGSDDAKVYLDGRTGQQYKNVTRLDASGAAGSLELGGSTAADVITGGQGSSSLWGGAGNVSDTLKGGSGENTFFYGLGEGNDVFVNVASTDKVMLYGINAADVTGATYSATKTTLTMSDGAKLTFNNLANGATFTLNDSEYTYNNKAFEKKA